MWLGLRSRPANRSPRSTSVHHIDRLLPAIFSLVPSPDISSLPGRAPEASSAGGRRWVAGRSQEFSRLDWLGSCPQRLSCPSPSRTPPRQRQRCLCAHRPPCLRAAPGPCTATCPRLLPPPSTGLSLWEGPKARHWLELLPA